MVEGRSFVVPNAEGGYDVIIVQKVDKFASVKSREDAERINKLLLTGRVGEAAPVPVEAPVRRRGPAKGSTRKKAVRKAISRKKVTGAAKPAAKKTRASAKGTPPKRPVNTAALAAMVDKVVKTS